MEPIVLHVHHNLRYFLPFTLELTDFFFIFYFKSKFASCDVYVAQSVPCINAWMDINPFLVRLNYIFSKY